MSTPKRSEKSLRARRFDRLVGRPLVVIIGIVLVAGGAYIIKHDYWKPEEFLRFRLENMGYTIEPSAMFRAIEMSDIRSISKLQRCGVPISSYGENGHTPLIAAIHENSPEILTELLSLGAPPTEADADGRSPFSHAVKLQNHTIIQRLLELGVDANGTVFEGTPALVWAIEKSDDEMVDLLLDSGADVAAESTGGAPIFVAVTAGHVAIVQQLLTAGADPNTLDPSGRPLAVAALDLKRPDMARQLLEASAAPNLKGRGDRSLVHRAFEDRDMELFDLAVRSGGDISIPAPDGRTLLEHAALKRETKWIELLLSHGADPNQRSADDNPIWWEFYNEGEIDLAEQLLAAGADINAKDAGDLRPVDRAMEIGNLRMVRYLHGRGAESETAGSNLWYPLLDKNYALMRLLLGQGEAPDQPNADDQTPFSYAIKTGDQTAAALLLEYGAKFDPNMKVSGHTLFEWSLAQGQLMMAEFLIGVGADPNMRITQPVSSEFLKQFEGHGNLQFYLKADQGLTPLMVVAGSGQHEMLKMLMKKGAKKSIYTKKWESWPINFAVKADDVRMAQLLLGRDPDTDGKDRRIVISLANQKATFYEHGEVKYSTKCSTGKKGYRTDPGVFVITNKNRVRRSNLYDADMPYFMRLSCSAIGMHQGYVPSYAASHGCVRLPYAYAKKFFATAEVGDIVEIK